MERMKYYLGIDGGGTKTAVASLEENANEIGRGLGGPCNIATCDDLTLTQSITEAVNEAREATGLGRAIEFEGVCAGVAGYTAKRRRAEFAELLKQLIPAKAHRVEPDYVIAYWGATEGEPGIIVSAGTGAVVYGRNAAGVSARFDGRGFLYGDKGSAFYIGKLAVDHILKRIDFGRPLDDFCLRVMRVLGAEDADDLIEWTYRDFCPSRIAALAVHVLKWADEDPNGLACHFVDSAADTLHNSTAMTMRKLGLTHDSVAVYLCGGLWQVSARLPKRFQMGHFNSISDEHPKYPWFRELRQPKHDPAFGAAYLMFQQKP